MSKPLRWLDDKVQTPPMSREARREMGFLLRQLQEGESLSLPHSRPMPSIGRGCHELRVIDQNKTWRLFYRLDPDAIVVLKVDEKKTPTTRKTTIDLCKQRIKQYEEAKKYSFRKTKS